MRDPRGQVHRNIVLWLWHVDLRWVVARGILYVV